MHLPLRILIVEDSEDDALLVLRQLRKGGYEPIFERVETAEAMRNALTEGAWDIILCDYKLPRFDGLHALEIYRELGIDIPFIIVSGAIGEETAVSAMKAGAHDYVMKANLARLVPTIEREIQEAEIRSDRRAILEALQASEEKFSRIFHNIPVAMAVTSMDDGRLLDVNQEYENLTEWTRKELIGRTIIELGLWFDAAERHNFLKEVVRRKGVKSYPPTIRTKTGRIASLLFSADIVDIGGKTCFLSSAVDVTERQWMEEKLRKSEEKYRFLTERMVDMIWTVDMDLRTTYISPSVIRILGFSIEDRKNMSLPEIMPPSSLKVATETFLAELARDGQPGVDPERSVTLELEYYRKDGGTMWFENVMGFIRDDKGTLAGIHGVSRDITERRIAQDALRESEEKYRILLEESPDPIFSFLPEGRYKYVNRAFADGVQKPVEDIIGRTIWDVFPKDEADKRFTVLSEIFHTGVEKSFEVRVPRTDDDRFYVTTVTPIQNMEGTIISAICSSKDITDRRRMEQVVRDSEEELSAIYENAPLIIMLVDDRWKVRKSNAFASRLTGKSPGDVTDLKCGDALCCVHALDVPEGCGFGPSCGGCAIRLSVLDAIATGVSQGNIDLDMTITRQGQEREVTFLISTKRVVIRGEHLALLSIQDITKRRQAEKALFERESDLSEAQRIAKLGSWRFDVQTRMVSWSDELYRIFDTDRMGFDSRYDSFLLFVHPDDMLKVLDTNKQILESGEPFDLTYRIITKSNQLKHIREVGYATRDEQGRIDCLLGTAQDVTERISVEKALAESEKRYRSIFDNAVEGIFQSTLEGRFITVNRAYAHIFGYDSPEEILETVTDIATQLYINPEDRMRAVQIMDLEGVLRDFECPVRRKDGSVIWISINSRFSRAPDGITCLEGFIIDITDKKRAEEALRQRDDLFRKLSSHVPGMIYQFLRRADGTYCVPFTSEAVEQIFGCSPEDVRNDYSPIARVIAPEDLDGVNESIESSAKDLSTWQYEYRVQLPGRPVRWMFGRSTPEALADGGIIWHGFITDVTERRRIMDELVFSREEMRALAGRLRDVREEERKRIARAIHDELGQALTGIKMDLVWMRRQMKRNGLIDHEKIMTRLESMGDLTDVTIREMRRIITELRPGILDDLGLVAALEWLVQEFRTRTGGESTFHGPAEDIELDPDRAVAIFRIAQEAMTNIIRHSGAKRVSLTLQTEEGRLLLHVIDDGSGFYEVDAKKRGAYGLLGMKERALAIGGTAKIHSMPGFGTTVSVNIPINDPDRRRE